jgi:hypothetical protein
MEVENNPDQPLDERWETGPKIKIDQQITKTKNENDWIRKKG